MSCDELDTILFYSYRTPCNINAILHPHGDRIRGVMVCVLALVDRRFEPLSDQTKYYKIGICCFSAKYAALRRKSKDGWLGMRIMCPNGVTFLPADCCFSELAL
jgi:hypothetical protein